MKRIACPNCDHQLKFTDDQAGKKARCPKCEHPFRLPTSPKPDSSGGIETTTGESRGAALAHLLNTLGTSDSSKASRSSDAANTRESKCAQCGGPAGRNKDLELWIHGYVDRTKLSTKFGFELPGTITTETEYSYKGFYQESGWLCEQCVRGAERRVFTLYAVIFGSIWLVLLIMSVYGVIIENYGWPIGSGIFFLFSLLVAFGAGSDAMAKAPENLFFKINWRRLMKMGLSVVGSGREPSD